MSNKLLDRILRESGVPHLLEVLGDRLAPTDLQSLLLEVYARRAARQTPARLLEVYEHNRFVRPSPTDPRTFAGFDRLAFSLASPSFEAIEVSPVCPLGASSAVAVVDQDLAVATIRNTEVVSDATNSLALECALRRRERLRADARSRERVRLCTSHRQVRAQHFDQPGLLAHFRVFALCTAGRDEGSHRFEVEALREHLEFHLRLLSALEEIGCPASRPRVSMTASLDEIFQGKLRAEVIEPLSAAFPGARLDLDAEPAAAGGYYERLSFKVHAENHQGTDCELAAGGFTDWTRKLLSNRKERLLISGIGTEMICGVFQR